MTNRTNFPNTFLEKQWVSLFADSEYPAIKLALVLFAWHEFVFYARYLPFVACDYIPFFRQYKIQPVCLLHLVIGDMLSPDDIVEQGEFEGTDLEVRCPCDPRPALCRAPNDAPLPPRSRRPRHEIH